MRKIDTTVFVQALFLLAVSVFLPQAIFAQSTDPEAPTELRESTISAVNSSNLSDETATYYAFNVSKGVLTWTLDLTPTNKSDGGGLLQWTLMTPKFEKLKYDNLSAQGSAERQVKDMPVTIKRRMILKIVVSGNVGYKIRLAGSALNFGGTK